MRIVAFVLLLMLVSGCAHAPKPGAAGTTLPAQGAEATPGATASAPPAPGVLNISWDGHLSGGACIPAGPDVCLDPGQGATAHEIHMVANATSWTGDVVLTWSSTTAADAQLTMSVTSFRGNAGQWEGFRESRTTGPSPLMLHVDIPDTGDERDGVAQTVQFPNALPAPLAGEVAIPLDFHMEGTLRPALA